MSTCEVPIETTLRNLITSEDLTEDQKVRAIEAVTRECNERLIIQELKKINTYLALITDHRL